jgi:diguanylate cyclase (GGDEF)-like protein
VAVAPDRFVKVVKSIDSFWTIIVKPPEQLKLMSDKTIKILLVDDNGGDARLLCEMLNGPSSRKYDLTHRESLEKAMTHLVADPVDIVLLDPGLPDAQGLGAVRRVHASAPRVALVVLTRLDDELLAAQALQEGAQDYLIKGQIEGRGLLRAVRYAIERKTMENAARAMALQIAHSAHHDFLTDLPNRMLLNDRINQAIALAQRHAKKVAVLFVDLDGFKHVNDSLGHSIGDKLLQSIARRLVGCARGTDTVSRQGGDEFVVLLSEMQHPEDAAIAARRMLKAVAETHSIDQHDLHITTSIGVSVYPDDGRDAETLIKNADTAMYQAKENGCQSYQFFKPAMNNRAVERQSLEDGLRRALERQEFALHYQPKINLRTGKITGAEALLRWTHPTRGSISPAQFIPVAEDCGLILPMGAWVLREACKQGRAWADAGLPAVTMAVNVSAIEFRDERFLEGLFAILGETGLDPRSLEVELTEGVLMKRAKSTASILQTLRERGVQVAIDDFGTGYSSLSYLQKFPVDALKVDQSFIRQISAIGDDATLVTAVIGMARSLKLRVVAEGVETLEALAFLRAHDCDEAQGYYFSRPVPSQRFARLLRTGIPELFDTAYRSPVMS